MSSIVIAGDTSGTVTLQAPAVAGTTTLNLPAASGTVPTVETTYSGFKNKIIGGDFTTNPWQRGTSFTGLASGSYGADRWSVNYVATTGVVNVLKTADAPTASQAGVFTQHCLHIDVTTADASIAAGDLFQVAHRVEGLNAACFGFGQSGTRYVALSFWHKHTKTGTYCVAFRNGTSDRSYIAEYTQDVTDVWEKATITIPVDTSGTWLYDTGVGLGVAFCLAAGTTLQTTASTWTSGSYYATANQVNALDSTANNFKIALVQLESGSVATPFETRSVGQELSLCQRYYETGATKHYHQSTSAAMTISVNTNFKVTKRASPSMVYSTGGVFLYVPTTTEELNVNYFTANRSATSQIEIGFLWSATAEL